MYNYRDWQDKYDVINNAVRNYDNNKPVSSAFFKSFDSKTNVFTRALYIAIAPIFYAGFSVSFLLPACKAFVKAILALITLNSQKALGQAYQLKENLGLSCLALILGALSPFILFVDFVGTVMTSIIPKKKVPDNNDSVMTI